MSDIAKIVGEAYRQMMFEDLTAAQRREWHDYDRELRIANEAIYRWRFVATMECEVEAI
jgi:hypothetical protein